MPLLTRIKSKVPKSAIIWFVRVRQPFLRFEANGFPPPHTALADILATGGPVTAERLLEGIRSGAVCHYPVWKFPKPRGVLFFDKLRAPKRDRSLIRRGGGYRISIDQAFDRVVHACADCLKRTDY